MCPAVCCAHWRVSLSSLVLYLRVNKEDVREAPCNKRTPNAKKRDHVTTWLVQYAADATQDMPDLDVFLGCCLG